MSVFKKNQANPMNRSKIISNALSETHKDQRGAPLKVTLTNGVVITEVTMDNIQVVAKLIDACNESPSPSQDAPFNEEVYSPFAYFCTNPSCEDYQVPSSEPCDCVSI